jgi:hypothetical protein
MQNTINNIHHGRCKEMSEAVVKADPTLRLVRGFYYCPITNERYSHWWTETSTGEIYDPTADQFMSMGEGDYQEFDGVITCEQCGKKVAESDAVIYGRHTYCSGDCFAAAVL